MKIVNLFLTLFLVASSSVFGQTSADLKQLLGKPTSETFQAENKVTVTAEYTSDGNVCRVKLSGKNYNVRNVAERLYTAAKKGGFIYSETVLPASGWRNGFVEQYQKITLRVSSFGDNVEYVYSYNDRKCMSANSVEIPQSEVKPVQLQTSVFPTAQAQPREFYRKYETDEPAQITFLPAPELTPEALQKFTPETMEIEAALNADGSISNVVMRGFLKNGMGDRVLRAVKKITFKPAVLDGQTVSQRVNIEYGIKKCDDGKICTFAREIVH